MILSVFLYILSMQLSMIYVPQDCERRGSKIGSAMGTNHGQTSIAPQVVSGARFVRLVPARRGLDYNPPGPRHKVKYSTPRVFVNHTR